MGEFSTSLHATPYHEVFGAGVPMLLIPPAGHAAPFDATRNFVHLIADTMIRSDAA